jgi:hypothetical protein
MRTPRFERQGETVSRQAHIPGYADTARDSRGFEPLPGNRRKTRAEDENIPEVTVAADKQRAF